MLFVILLAAFVSACLADLPINCYHTDVVGEWEFELSSATHEVQYDHSCGHHRPDSNIAEILHGHVPLEVKRTILVTLESPNLVINQAGKEIGKWTMVEDVALHVQIGGLSLAAYFVYKSISKDGNLHDVADLTSYQSSCWKTIVDRWDDFTLNESGCFRAEKTPPTGSDQPRRINRFVKEWPEERHTVLQGQRLYLSRARFPRRRSIEQPFATVVPNHENLPSFVDWRNRDGVNYVSPVRDQGQCGSCYAVSAISVIEARLRIKNLAPMTVKLNVDDLLQCSRANQACDGGYPYLVGLWVARFGLVDDSTCESGAVDHKCITEMWNERMRCRNRYMISPTTRYLGSGFYGSCSEEAMMAELHHHGPVVVAIDAPRSLQGYKGGILTEPEPSVRVSPVDAADRFVRTTHAVVCIGYGQDDNSGQRYWIVQNSWGASWGLKGYFLVERGHDYLGIESMAIAYDPI